MDAYIDTNDTLDEIINLSEKIKILQYLIQVMNEKLRIAGEEFTSINFQRASTNVQIAGDSMNTMNENLESAKSYLNQLIEQIDKYNSLKY